MTGKLTGSGAEDDEDDVQKKALTISTFEPRHENKSCSACLKDQT